MGVHTGPVVVGKIGDDLRMDYTAVGDTTNLAARLQHMAEPGTILISEAVRRLMRTYLRVEDVGPLHLNYYRDCLDTLAGDFMVKKDMEDGSNEFWTPFRSVDWLR
jgi:class 3 adenylate cyclase